MRGFFPFDFDSELEDGEARPSSCQVDHEQNVNVRVD